MMRTVTSAIVLGATVLACRTPRLPPGSEPRSRADVDAAPPAMPTPSSTPAKASPPVVTITNLGPGRFRLRSGRDPVPLNVLATIEIEKDGSFQPVENLELGAGYRLLARCPDEGAPSAECVTVTADGFEPIPWSGFACSAQCNVRCRANPYWAGKFRLVVTPCGDGQARVVGPVFELPSEPDAIERWSASEGIASATAVRLTLPPRWDGTAPGKAGSLAGMITAGSERPLDASLRAELAAALRTPHGFEDRVAKRCVMGTLVGYRVVRALPPSSGPREEETVEIAMDFTCEKLFVVRAGGADGKRVVHATHFEPSRPAFLALAKKALPHDPVVVKLR